MFEIILVLCCLGFSVALLLGLIFMIEFLASRYPNTTIGRMCKSINDFISRLPED